MYNTGCCQLLIIFICGLVLTLIPLFFLCLIHVFGENSKHLYMYVIVTGVYNPLTARWHYLEDYLLEIVWIALGVTVAPVIFWCVIRVFGDNSKY